MNDLDFTGMRPAERHAYTVGELMTPLLNPDWYPGAPLRDGEPTIAYYRSDVATADLLKLAEVGKGMLYDAICVAAEQNDVTFFEEAYGYYGHLITVALEGMDLPDRCGCCGVLLPHTEECKSRGPRRTNDNDRKHPRCSRDRRCGARNHPQPRAHAEVVGIHMLLDDLG